MSRIAYLEDAQERDMPRRIAPQERLSGAAGKGQRESAAAGWTMEMKATLARKLAAFSPETQRLCAEYMRANRA